MKKTSFSNRFFCRITIVQIPSPFKVAIGIQMLLDQQQINGTINGAVINSSQVFSDFFYSLLNWIFIHIRLLVLIDWNEYSQQQQQQWLQWQQQNNWKQGANQYAPQQQDQWAWQQQVSADFRIFLLILMSANWSLNLIFFFYFDYGRPKETIHKIGKTGINMLRRMAMLVLILRHKNKIIFQTK